MELENKYNNSIVYKIVCNVTGLVYIGSTTQTIYERLNGHKRAYKCFLGGNYHFVTSFKVLENNNYYIKKIKSYNVESKEELHIKEAYWIKKYESVNKVIPNRTPKEYREVHKDELIAYQSEYYENNKSELLAYQNNYRIENKIEISIKHKEYRDKNKDAIYAKRSVICLCICGCNYAKISKARHEKTKKHLTNLIQFVN